jgi:uncharacterized membrane-anchored protein YhcB (DUF1043 family)
MRYMICNSRHLRRYSLNYYPPTPLTFQNLLLKDPASYYLTSFYRITKGHNPRREQNIYTNTIKYQIKHRRSQLQTRSQTISKHHGRISSFTSSLCVLAYVKIVQKEIANNPQFLLPKTHEIPNKIREATASNQFSKKHAHSFNKTAHE